MKKSEKILTVREMKIKVKMKIPMKCISFKAEKDFTAYVLKVMK